MEKYAELRKRQQEEFDKFPLGFAFSQKQFEEMMAKWGLTTDDTDKICRLPSGGFLRKTDRDAFRELLQKHERELRDAIDADKTGGGFIFQMFYYELKNHEYGYTGDATETLDALGYTYEDLQANERLFAGFEKAKARIMREE